MFMIIVRSRSEGRTMSYSRRAFLGWMAAGITAAARIPGAQEPAAAAPLPPPGAGFWDDVQGRFRVDPDQHFFNTGTLGPCPRSVRERVIETLEALDARPTYHYWARCMPRYFEIRAKAARLLGASDPRSVTLTHSTTEGINIVARGLELQAGDEVVMTTHEHPGGDSVWRYLAATLGMAIRRYDIPMTPPDDDAIVGGIQALLSPRTRLLMVSHVLYTNGLIMPVERLAEVARERGVLFLVDGAHTAGQMAVDVERIGCDFYATSGHKWLCGPKGTGLLYVRPERLAELRPLLVSYDFRHVPHDVTTFDEGATRLNFVWTNDLQDVMGLEAALDFHFELGPDRVRRHDLELTRRFREGIDGVPGLRRIDVGEERRNTPMTTLEVDGPSSERIFHELRRLGYTVKQVLDEELPAPFNGVRVCTHVFNSEDQVDGLVAAFGTVMRGVAAG
jgi:isopenicillin-N epimerase